MAESHFLELRLTFSPSAVPLPYYDALAQSCEDARVTSVVLAGLSGLKPAHFLRCRDVRDFHADDCRIDFDMTGVSQALSADRSFNCLRFQHCRMSSEGLLELSRIKARVENLSLEHLNLLPDASPCDLAGLFSIPGLEVLGLRGLCFDYLAVSGCATHERKENFVRSVRESKVKTLDIVGCGDEVAALVVEGLHGNCFLERLVVDSVGILPSLLRVLEDRNKTLCHVDQLSVYRMMQRPALWEVHGLVDARLDINERFQRKKRDAEKTAARQMAALVWCWENMRTSLVGAPATLGDIPLELLQRHVKPATLVLPRHPNDEIDDGRSSMPPRKKQRLSESGSD
jgi:hypothetical protein